MGMCRRRVGRLGSTPGRCRALGTGGHARPARDPVCADTPRGSTDYTYLPGVPCRSLPATTPPAAGLVTSAHVSTGPVTRRVFRRPRIPHRGVSPWGKGERNGGGRRITRYYVSPMPVERCVWCNNARQAHDSLLAVGPGLVARPVLQAPAGHHFAMGDLRGGQGGVVSVSASETRAALGVTTTAHAPALADRRIVLPTRK